jgi:hypothetical protein
MIKKPARTSPKEIGALAREAALKAATRYVLMSGGKSVHDHAIETYVSAIVAETIFDAFQDLGCNAGLEVPFAEIHEQSGATKQGAANKLLPPKARFDVVVYKDKKPYGLIEIKKRFVPSNASSDVIRLSEAVRRYGEPHSGSVKFALFIGLQRFRDNSRLDVEKQKSQFKDSHVWSVEPILDCDTVDGDFGISRRFKRPIVRVGAFTALFVS